MNILRTLSFFFLLLPVTYMEAQNRLESETNMIRSGDSIVCRQIEYFSPGNTGEGQEWDFRGLEALDNHENLWFVADSDSVTIYGLTPVCRRKYLCQNDSLLTLGYETRLQTLTYEEPLALLTFPCTYGESAEQQFHGRGSYCKKYVIESQGTMESDVDATGVIYYNQDDTLYNVLRIHRVYYSSISQRLPNDSIADNQNVKQRIEEHYLWYARGYRYPVFETISTTIFVDLSPVSCQQVAYCTLPSDQLLLNDSLNRDIQQSDSLIQIPLEESSPIHYQVFVNGDNVEVSYTLESDARIQASVCDRRGMVYKRGSTSGHAGESGLLNISCSGLRHGVYILYLNVNGQIFCEKINLL